jgi:hypothetical protein
MRAIFNRLRRLENAGSKHTAGLGPQFGGAQSLERLSIGRSGNPPRIGRRFPSNRRSTFFGMARFGSMRPGIHRVADSIASGPDKLGLAPRERHYKK